MFNGSVKLAPMGLDPGISSATHDSPAASKEIVSGPHVSTMTCCDACGSVVSRDGMRNAG